MKRTPGRYPLEALRRVRRDSADRATGRVAARLAEWSATEEARVGEERRLAAVEQRIREQDLPDSVVELRALAIVGAHRTRLRAERDAAREALAAAAGRVDAARTLLEDARQAQRDAVARRAAVERHHEAWRCARSAARLAAEDEGAAEVVAARWGRS